MDNQNVISGKLGFGVCRKRTKNSEAGRCRHTVIISIFVLWNMYTCISRISYQSPLYKTNISYIWFVYYLIPLYLIWLVAQVGQQVFTLLENLVFSFWVRFVLLLTFCQWTSSIGNIDLIRLYHWSYNVLDCGKLSESSLNPISNVRCI